MYFGAPGLPELMIIAVIVLLLFGKRLPSVMRSLGQSVTEFRRGVQHTEDDDDDSRDRDDSDRKSHDDHRSSISS
ncbi:MAG: twin-arginine translocase TatA/TatE family subunit [Planctomycetaceae bacterium]|nr:twin-arginine translocase TatA/TatE family subunit [Planctomycetaceae bacterium]